MYSARSDILCSHKEFLLENIVKSGFCQGVRFGIAHGLNMFVEEGCAEEW